MPALFPPTVLTWGVIHPGACADLGLQARLRPGRLFVEPLLSLYSPLCSGWHQRPEWDQVLGDLGGNSHLTSTSADAGVPSSSLLSKSADSQALKHSQQGAVAPVGISLEAVCVCDALGEISSATQALKYSLRYIPLYFTNLEADFS